MSVLASVLVAAEKSPSEEGTEIIVGMLIVACIFLGVIVLGQLGRWIGTKRGRAH